MQCTSVVSDGFGAKLVTRCSVIGETWWGGLVQIFAGCALAHEIVSCLHDAVATYTAGAQGDLVLLLLFVGCQAAHIGVAAANECLESWVARQN